MYSAQNFLLEFRSTRNFKVAIPLLLENEALRNAVFKEFDSETYPFPEYSSWLAIHFFEKNPTLFTEEICAFIIQTLLKTTNHSMQRNLCTVLFHYKKDLSENVELLDKLLFFLTDKDSLPALRIHALKNLEFHYLKAFPELTTEITAAFELLSEFDQPSIRSMIRNFRKKHKIN